MGKDSKSSGHKCGCSKTKKKSQGPRRGPGVAELEKILNGQKHGQARPLYGSSPFMNPYMPLPPPPQPLPFPGVQFQYPQSLLYDGPSYLFSNTMLSQQSQETDAFSGLTFTQMMTVNDDVLFPPTMNNANLSSAASHPIPPPSSAINPFISQPSSRKFCFPEENLHQTKRPKTEMPSEPHDICALQLAPSNEGNSTALVLYDPEKTNTENSNALVLYDQGRMIPAGGNVAEFSEKENPKAVDGSVLSLGISSPDEQAEKGMASPDERLPRATNVEPDNSTKEDGLDLTLKL